MEFWRGPEDLEPILTAPIPEKADRTRFHAALRSLFRGQLVSDTQGETIRIAKRGMEAKERKKARLDKRNFQDRDRVDCIRLVLQKEAMETLEACQCIAWKLGINPKDINTAGTKDKRAITSQFITIRYVNPKKLEGVNGMAGGKIRISNIGKCDQTLQLGDLSGNRFTLILRSVEGEDGAIEAAVESLKAHGFINYYGLQRFGTMAVKSHDVGIKLLQGKWQEAIDLILAPREDETDGMAKHARRIWAQERDAKAAYDLFPVRYNAERQILWHFHKQGNQTDLVGALLSINRELRLMYVHSVQSLVWNRLVSQRIAKLGRQPVVGDLVMGKGLPPTHLTEETVGKYTIYDVVMPLPGYDIKAPGGAVGQIYQDLVEQEFQLMDKDCFSPKTKALWDLPGAYRSITTLPKDVSFHIGHYDDPDMTIQGPSDLKPEGRHKAAFVSFSLQTSSYATMAMREIMSSI